LNQDGTGKLKLVDSKNKVTCSMGEEYSKEEILRIPTFFQDLIAKHSETPDAKHLKSLKKFNKVKVQYRKALRQRISHNYNSKFHFNIRSS
jgi:hypothetical protein